LLLRHECEPKRQVLGASVTWGMGLAYRALGDRADGKAAPGWTRGVPFVTDPVVQVQRRIEDKLRGADLKPGRLPDQPHDPPPCGPHAVQVLRTYPDAHFEYDFAPHGERSIARAYLAQYLQLPNYTNNLLRHGFTPEDLAGGGSDRLVDALVAWGSVDAIRERVADHLRAGADHVCLQALTEDPATLPLDEWRTLAALVDAFEQGPH